MIIYIKLCFDYTCEFLNCSLKMLNYLQNYTAYIKSAKFSSPKSCIKCIELMLLCYKFKTICEVHYSKENQVHTTLVCLS